MRHLLLGSCDEASYVWLRLGHSKANIVPNIKTVSGLRFNGRQVRKSRFAKVYCGELNVHFGCLLAE